MFGMTLDNIKKLMYYFTFSCISSVLDLLVTTTLFKVFFVHYMIANTVGIIAGFIIHFILSSKVVFNVRPDIKSFGTYLATFLVGLILANTVLFLSFEMLRLDFYISKFMSMAIPFFVTYSLRIFAYRFIEGLDHDKQRV